MNIEEHIKAVPLETFAGPTMAYISKSVIGENPIKQMILVKTSVVCTGFRGEGVRWAIGVKFYIGEIKNFAFIQTPKFSKMLKNQWNI